MFNKIPVVLLLCSFISDMEIFAKPVEFPIVNVTAFPLQMFNITNLLDMKKCFMGNLLNFISEYFDGDDSSNSTDSSSEEYSNVFEFFEKHFLDCIAHFNNITLSLGGFKGNSTASSSSPSKTGKTKATVANKLVAPMTSNRSTTISAATNSSADTINATSADMEMETAT